MPTRNAIAAGRALAAVLIMLLIGAFASGCGKEARAKEAGRFYYESWSDDFSVVFPRGWEVSKKQAGTLAMALSPAANQRDVFRENTNILSEKLGWLTSVEDYIAANLKNLGKQLRSFKIVRRGQERIDAHDAYWFIFDHEMQGHSLRVLTYAIFDGGKCYILTNTAAKKTFSGYQRRFEEIARSFRVE